MRASGEVEWQTSNQKDKIFCTKLPDTFIYYFINSKIIIEGHLLSSVGCECSAI